ncbi:cytochrome c, class I [Hydrogenimonas sp.]|nr:cytochrome c, class I [Hydrogenimonas sp.]
MRVEAVLIAVLFPLLAYPAQESLRSAGERLYMSMGCYGCHGVSGEGVNDFPKLAGKPADYLKERLKELKKGVGHTSRKEMMVPYAKALSDEQIDEVSAYLSSSGSSDEESMEVPEEIMGGDL